MRRVTIAAAAISALALSAALNVATAASNPLSISQTPSVYGTRSISPNLFFLLDDSGSMQFEYLGSRSPDNSRFPYGYPVGAAQPYGGATYCYYSYSGSCNANYTPNEVPGFDAGNRYAAQYRAAFINPNYYNPTVTYTPWACSSSYPQKSTNTSVDSPVNQLSTCHWDSNVSLWVMPNADPNQAYLNPADTSAGYRSVNVWNDSSNDKQKASNNGFAGESSTLWYLHYDAGSNCYAHSGGYYHCEGTVAFWPATYFNYVGPRPGTSSDFQDASNYQRVQICPASPTTNSDGDSSADHCTPPPALPSNPKAYHTYTGAGGDYVYVQSDGTQVKRTPAQEMQNFANWFQYYRSHILMSWAGISIAFMQLPDSFRVDFGLISQMSQGLSHFPGNTGLKSAEDFSEADRAKFLAHMVNQSVPPQGTPDRLALKNVGEWYATKPNSSAPWASSFDEQKAGADADPSCRANYTILMTDGQWSGGSPDVGNVDGTDGPSIPGTAGKPAYQYQPSNPYQDNVSNTLADVAQQYWETDLQTGLANNVPTNTQDPGYWQHMVTFTVGLGVVPSLVQSYMQSHPSAGEKSAQDAVFSDISNGSLSWPSPYNNSAAKIDDLWHAAIDGHGTYASAQDPTQLYKAISSALINIVNRTASASSPAVNTQKVGQARAQVQVFQAVYHPENWWGDVLALPLDFTVTQAPNSSTTRVSATVESNATWSASCILTGGPCPQMGKNASGAPTHTVSVESPSSRQVLTWNGVSAQGAPFEASTLPAAAVSMIGGASVVDYIRGDRSREAANGGTLRTRKSVMGDVVRSNPTFVGPPDAGYPDQWSNLLYPSQTEAENGSSATPYSQFKSNNSSRESVVYAGANDGMLHAFWAGDVSQAGSQAREMFAYVPGAVFPNLKQYSQESYKHHYYVNATPDVADVFYGGTWHSWLVGGEGAGGDSVYALDVTKPSGISENSASSTVKGEWNPNTISCAAVTNCGNDMGDSFGTPVLTKFNNDEWGFVFGNGYNSSTGVASIFIGLISSTGNVSFRELKTGYGPSNDPTGANRPDGIAFAEPVDLNGDHTADYIYAGDYFGNVWRFNLTSSNPADWQAAYGGTAGQPMFHATNGTASQPVTTRPVVLSVPSGSGYPRILVEFGTGTDVTTGDQAPDTSAGGVQSLYGIWDWDLSGWDNGSPESGVSTTTPVSAKYDAIPRTAGSVAPPSLPMERGSTTLTQQSILAEQTTNTTSGGANNNRVIGTTAVCWADDTCASTSAGSYGWYLDLVSPSSGRQGEKVIYNPVLRNGVLVVNTTIPTVATGKTCQAFGLSGWTLALDPANGGRLPFEAFDTKGDGKFDEISYNSTQTATSGIALGAVGSPSFVSYKTHTFLVVNTGSGKASATPVNLNGGPLAYQLAWQELR